MANEDETDLNHLLTGEDRPAARRSASSGVLCERCRTPLTGKKQRWCSDACRMADRRDGVRRRRLELLDGIDAAVKELRADVGGLND